MRTRNKLALASLVVAAVFVLARFAGWAEAGRTVVEVVFCAGVAWLYWQLVLWIAQKTTDAGERNRQESEDLYLARAIAHYYKEKDELEGEVVSHDALDRMREAEALDSDEWEAESDGKRIA